MHILALINTFIYYINRLILGLIHSENLYIFDYDINI